MFKYLKALAGIDLAYIFLLSYLTRGLINQFSYQDVIVCIGLIAFCSFKRYLDSKTPKKHELDAELRSELDNMKAAINALKLERNMTSVQPAKPRFF